MEASFVSVEEKFLTRGVGAEQQSDGEQIGPGGAVDGWIQKQQLTAWCSVALGCLTAVLMGIRGEPSDVREDGEVCMPQKQSLMGQQKLHAMRYNGTYTTP